MLGFGETDDMIKATMEGNFFYLLHINIFVKKKVLLADIIANAKVAKN